MDQDHPDLNISVGANYVDGGSWDDDNGHGTHVAGTVAGLDNTIGVVGVAPDVTLIAAKVADRRGRITPSDAVDGMYGCTALRDSIDPNLPLIINMSFHLNPTAQQREMVFQAIEDIVATATTELRFVGSAGNHGDPCMSVPAWHPDVHGVTAVNEDLSFADYSAYGWYPGSPTGTSFCAGDPTFMAPGTDVLSLYKGGGTKTLTGTSMAAAHVSGVFALAFSANSLGPVGVDKGLEHYRQGDGLIDAEATVLNTVPTPGITVGPTSGLVTGEDGTPDSFAVVLDSQPTATVTIDLSSSDVEEGTLVDAINNSLTLSFNEFDWNTPQLVTVVGVDDAAEDGDIDYAIITAAVVSTDPDYSGRDPSDVAVTNVDDDGPIPTTMHVSDLDASTSPTAKGKWNAFVTIAVVDGSRTPVVNAIASGSWSGGVSGSSTCTTDIFGMCVISKNNIKNNVSSVVFSVTDIVLANYVYDPAADDDPDGDSDGTVITILKP